MGVEVKRGSSLAKFLAVCQTQGWAVQTHEMPRGQEAEATWSDCPDEGRAAKVTCYFDDRGSFVSSAASTRDGKAISAWRRKKISEVLGDMAHGPVWLAEAERKQREEAEAEERQVAQDRARLDSVKDARPVRELLNDVASKRGYADRRAKQSLREVIANATAAVEAIEKGEFINPIGGVLGDRSVFEVERTIARREALMRNERWLTSMFGDADEWALEG